VEKQLGKSSHQLTSHKLGFESYYVVKGNVHRAQMSEKQFSVLDTISFLEGENGNEKRKKSEWK
jgi:hypothetical protein